MEVTTRARAKLVTWPKNVTRRAPQALRAVVPCLLRPAGMSRAYVYFMTALLVAACSNNGKPSPPPPPPVPAPVGYLDYEPDYVADSSAYATRETRVRITDSTQTVRYVTDRPQPNCGQSFAAEDKLWFPGLPMAPVTKPRATGLTEGPVAFTDAGRDRLLPFAIAQLQARGENPAAREFANLIGDVSVYTELETGDVQAQFTVENQPVTLRGRFGGPDLKDRVNVPLKQVKGRAFAGRVTCADVTGGCESILLTIKRLGERGETLTEAKVVHRFGTAHVQVAPDDQYGFMKYKNPAHRQFAEYLSNTVNNACLAVLYDIRNGARQEEACTIEKLQKECGGQRVKIPSAKVFGIRTWAVVYGRSAFEFNAQDKETRMSRRSREQARFVLAGPLLAGQTAPVAPGLAVLGAIGVLKADLIANDGAGSLNVQMVFAGEPRSHTRVSITTLFERTRQELQGNGVASPQAAADWVK